MNREARGAIAIVVSIVLVAFAGIALASDGGPHPGTWKTWHIGPDPIIVGFDPHETIEDVAALSGHVGAPTMITAGENFCGGFCSIMFWNPVTNVFKSYCVTGGFDFAIAMDRRAASGAAMVHGGGDAWTAVGGNSGFSPWMIFRGSNDLRRWNLGASCSTGLRVHPATGKVYMGNTCSSANGDGEIIELDPTAGTVRKFPTGNRPYNFVIVGEHVYATAFDAGGGDPPDQILRLDPTTGELLRWTVPAAGFQGFVSFGTPNSISVDAEGSIWFSESDGEIVGRLRAGGDGVLGTPDDEIDEYDKPGLLTNPHSVKASGSGGTLQSFFTEADVAPPEPDQHLSVLTVSAATPVTAVVSPTTEFFIPPTAPAIAIDFIHEPVQNTIEPVVTPVMSTDPTGIDRFPLPAGHDTPTGMTKVVGANTVYGSIEGTDHLFEFKSEVIVAEPECGDGNLDPGEECDDGNNVNGDGCSENCETEFVIPAMSSVGLVLLFIMLTGVLVLMVGRNRRSEVQ